MLVGPLVGLAATATQKRAGRRAPSRLSRPVTDDRLELEALTMTSTTLLPS
jgi:hypothetical protein